jgi:hypothetical protein
MAEGSLKEIPSSCLEEKTLSSMVGKIFYPKLMLDSYDYLTSCLSS